AVADDASRLYLSVTDAGPQDLADVVSATPGVSDPRVVETRENGCSASVRVDGGSVVRALIEHGATVRDATATDGEVRVVGDLPEGTDVRPVADGLRAAFPDVRLASKESVARSPATESSFREGIADRFTDRQWAALSAAYHGGYFDWPRGSTAEEVADAMEVSSPTFHNHLRKAQRALLDGLFEDGRRR
ncbi:bacterio-opsin activator, partial [Halorubrum sp. CBA1125]|uniref:helix-turn-helix domain-containing protein n=1 Tax=Halorubrum sp. CBA1125 TaxID=2668072 RepID=UPI00135EA6E6